MSIGNSGIRHASFEACGDLYIKVVLAELIRSLAKETHDDITFTHDPVLQSYYTVIRTIDIDDATRDKRSHDRNVHLSPYQGESEVLQQMQL